MIEKWDKNVKGFIIKVTAKLLNYFIDIRDKFKKNNEYGLLTNLLH